MPFLHAAKLEKKRRTTRKVSNSCSGYFFFNYMQPFRSNGCHIFKNQLFSDYGFGELIWFI